MKTNRFCFIFNNLSATSRHVPGSGFTEKLQMTAILNKAHVKMELATQYNPKEAEKDHYERWEKSGFFKPEINENISAEKYSIVIPPPNVTGSLHMGHALQHTLMDVLIRRKRMQGFKTLWLPGTDHAGISVQRKVVEQLSELENKTPHDIGREEFVFRAWGWKERYGNTITDQMRREGASVDWSRHRFTMDESLSWAVRAVFCTLYEEGWIYRGLRIVNWCPHDLTVLSDLEVKEETRKDGKLTFLKYPVKDTDRTITVATTRPETMLGDSAVAVNPKDSRYRDLIGKFVKLPLTDREIPIVGDEYVDPEFGTGAVKVTPAHDPNDYQIGERHDLPKILVMNDDASMNANAGPEFEGLDRFEARKKVVAAFEELGLLEKVEDYEITLPICERCKTIVEPILSDQWFVKMDEMRDMALDLIKNEGIPHFYPEVPHTKVYTNWLENLKDWTISRQLWWGHQIPAWYDKDRNIYVALTEEEAIEKAGTTELVQDQDVLDTWFSSALWAFSTFGWTGTDVGERALTAVHEHAFAGGDIHETEEKIKEFEAEASDLETYCPTDVLVTGRDIIFLWVSRMIMTTKKFVNKHAFKDVLVTGTVLGSDGKPMSKSRGNGVDPIEMFDRFGVDATRIYLAGIATGMDIRWNDTQIETFRNFANKIWNATRFCLMNSGGAKVDHSSLMERSDLSIADRWIISRLNRTAIGVNKAIDQYFFHEAVQLLYHFFWDDFCDWYIELVKDEITLDPSAENDLTAKQIEARTRIITILEIALRMLHPFMPYLTEELWQKLPAIGSNLHHEAYRSADPTIMLASFPPGDAAAIDEKAESEMQLIIELISKIRNIRAEMRIKSSERFDVHIAADAKTQAIFSENKPQILKLARAKDLTMAETLNVPKASAKGVLTNGTEIAIPLEGLIDFEMERERLSAQINNLDNEGKKLKTQLSNENFVTKAPAEKVEALRDRVAEIDTQIFALRENLRALQ